MLAMRVRALDEDAQSIFASGMPCRPGRQSLQGPRHGANSSRSIRSERADGQGKFELVRHHESRRHHDRLTWFPIEAVASGSQAADDEGTCR